jgi:hypothetical protein
VLNTASWYIIQKLMLLIFNNYACGLHTEARLLHEQVGGIAHLSFPVSLLCEA